MRLTMIKTIRTNNFNDDQMMPKIIELWKEASQHFTSNEQIKYGVYHEYESNYKGDYSLSVAIENKNEDSFIEIPKNEKYDIFKVDTTEEQGIINTWSKIWELEEAGTLKRAYTVDFEKYSPNGDVEIYIAVK